MNGPTSQPMRITLATALIRLLALIPLPMLYWTAVPLGWLARLIPWYRHKVIAANLKLCFPELSRRERRRLHRQHLIEMMRIVLESGAVWYWSRARLEKHVRRVEGWELVEKAHKAGRGVLVVGAHFGNWEILTLWISLKMKVSALYRAPKQPQVDKLITGSRSRFGARLIASGSPAMRHLLAALKQGGTIGMLCDQQPKQGEGVFVPFFGVPARTMTLVNRLARRTGCAVIFVTAERLPTGRGWALHFSKADASIAADDPKVGVRTMHRWLENEIRRDPAQYLWNYKRFSLRPEGEPPVYPPKRKQKTDSP